MTGVKRSVYERYLELEAEREAEVEAEGVEPGVGGVTLDDLEPGALFETRGGTLAVKSEYHLPNGQWMCILLASGEYAHFAEGNNTEVRELALSSVRCAVYLGSEWVWRTPSDEG